MEIQNKCFFSLLGLITVLIATSRTGMARNNEMDDSEKLAFLMTLAGQELQADAIMQANPPCIVKKKWSEDLTLSKLKDMTGIFMGKPFTNYVPPKTYIFVPTTCPMLKTYGNVFVSGSDKHAEDWMMEKCGRPTSFYLTSAPCPDCAMMLRNKYKDEEESPTIYIARPYIGKGKTGKGSKDVNMQCLAMLVQAGFKLLPWNWRKFPQYINNNECKKAIERMYAGTIKSMSTYNERFEETKSALKEVKEMANSMTDINYTTNCRNALKG